MAEGTEQQRPNGIRADKWLWAVRVFKTRQDAATACRLSQVRVMRKVVKPSRLLRVGDTVEVEQETLTRTVEVIGLIDKRVGAQRVPEFLHDKTPEAMLEQARLKREQERQNRVFHHPGDGRPTKKDRREMDEFESQK